jgi:ParB/RepB/Spo0J family partition protein
MKIPVEEIIIPSSRTPRDYGDMRAFCRSIEEHGQLQPICVELIGDRFSLVFGGRRLEAFKKLGAPQIWAELRENLSPVQRKEIELTENLERKQFSILERQRALRELYLLKKEEYEKQGDVIGIRFYSQQRFAEELNLHQSEVSRAIKLAEASDKFPELLQCSSLTEAERTLRRILLEQRTGISPNSNLELVEDIVGTINSLPPLRLCYAILSPEDHYLISSLEDKLDSFGTLIVETDSPTELPLFLGKPSIVQETGKETYQELYVLSRGKSNPLGERVMTVERSYDFSLNHSHSRLFWEKILKNTIGEVQNQNIVILNPNDLSMTEFCFTSQYKVRYLFTDQVLYQQMKAHQGGGK